MEATATEVMACSRTTVRCADARSYEHRLRPCCRRHVIDIVRHATVALTTARAVFWADYGTLLGSIRNPLTTWADYSWLEAGTEPIAPGIVPHDKDADFGVLFTSWGKAVTAVRQLRREHDYDINIRAHRGSMKIRLSAKNHTNLDLFFWYERRDGSMYRRAYAQSDAFKGREFNRAMLFPLATVEWEGLTLPAPHDPEAFLAMRYGANWMVPIMANSDGIKR